MLKTKEEIKAWLDKYKVEDYTINDDLTVDVNGGVEIEDQGLTEIPIQFGKVNGGFNCSHNNLTSCTGFPIELSGDLSCSGNHITSLVGCPKVLSNLYCSHNKITSLIDGPEKVEGWYDCSNNELTSLIGVPLEIPYNFSCAYNKLETLEDGPQNVGGSFVASFNPIKTLANFSCKFEGEFRHFGKPIPIYESFYSDTLGIGSLSLTMQYDELKKVTETIELVKELSELKVNETQTKKPKI